ncbi:hypothetical protein CesoFtcFv8_009445 [Champsocephalus esox]|uniref:RING-type domain-containing protein n=1 Tax=Champsocephalus esox TaxID=159716 RepID=A0AAN8C9H3_9TELE|nr:hypothetical protein CesoFtcFv8_009445 [Champsocephalus esox]
MMAAMDQSPFSLLSLEEELSCSICLCPFDCPVTIPCGHNFCQDCIVASWKDSYSCPQCRTHFPTKPELKRKHCPQHRRGDLQPAVDQERGRPGDSRGQPSGEPGCHTL